MVVVAVGLAVVVVAVTGFVVAAVVLAVVAAFAVVVVSVFDGAVVEAVEAVILVDVTPSAGSTVATVVVGSVSVVPTVGVGSPVTVLVVVPFATAGSVVVETGVLFVGVAFGRFSKNAAINTVRAKNTNSRIMITTLLVRRGGGVVAAVVFSISDLIQYGQNTASGFSSAPQNGHGFMFDHPSTFSPYSYKRALISSTDSFLQMPKITTQSNSFLAYNAA